MLTSATRLLLIPRCALHIQHRILLGRDDFRGQTRPTQIKSAGVRNSKDRNEEAEGRKHKCERKRPTAAHIKIPSSTRDNPVSQNAVIRIPIHTHVYPHEIRIPGYTGRRISTHNNANTEFGLRFPENTACQLTPPYRPRSQKLTKKVVEANVGIRIPPPPITRTPAQTKTRAI